MSASFTVTLPAERVAPDVLGVWRAEAGGLAFDAGADAGAGVGAGLLWRVSLPHDARAFAESLARRERILADAGPAVLDARARLEAFARRRPGADGASFDALAALAQPEQEFALLWMQAEGVVAFSGSVFDRLRELAEEARRFLRQVEDAMRYYAQVETVQDGVLLARSRFGWSGDALATSRTGLRPDQVALHRRTVDAVLRTRAGWIHLAFHFVQSAAMLAGGILTGNPLLAAGGAWKFYKDVLAEWQKLQDHAAVLER